MAQAVVSVADNIGFKLSIGQRGDLLQQNHGGLHFLEKSWQAQGLALSTPVAEIFRIFMARGEKDAEQAATRKGPAPAEDQADPCMEAEPGLQMMADEPGMEEEAPGDDAGLAEAADRASVAEAGTGCAIAEHDLAHPHVEDQEDKEEEGVGSD